jgi:hypothetical protein
MAPVSPARSYGGVVKPDAGRVRLRAPSLRPTAQPVEVARRAGRDRAPSQRSLPVDVGRGRLDLAEDDFDHLVDELSWLGT